MYSEREKLKENKFDHVMSLAKNYVPLRDQWFYEILNYHRSFTAGDEETTASEFKCHQNHQVTSE